MKTIILGAGVLAITAVVIAAVVANATTGDAIYVKRDNGRYALPASSAPRAAVVALIGECYPGLGISTFQTIRCTHAAKAPAGLVSILPEWRCTGEQFTAAVTDAQRLDLVLAGGGQDVTGANTTTTLDLCSPSPVTVNTATQAVFGRSQDAVGDFMCERGSGSPSCVETFVTTASPTAWATDLKAGLVVGTIGKVQ